ncbi:LacI family DNA-binding transcriptional regulator [Paenibacillus sp. OAS669]|uniref:LacI family DNA-binding transcriptional regulator n=1 Tax=Paenibacillus sp. OAS669 TaxID=2663821 RepID=UPI00178B1233|nr:LacI family DNA-binding transcriptional regulator [Paenibacillus sp. OAS669]MBE1444969.1 LacI family transcriptional regulator [Paenibacillus sp. OAS669]
MVTIYDIAKKANVSPMTVSRVINHAPSISEATRRKVEAIIQELDYIPNKQARSLTSKETKIVSLVIPDISNPFFTTIARGAEDKAHQFGYQLLLGNTDEQADKESRYIDMLLSAQVDGVLIAPTGEPSLAHLRKLAKRKVPFVFADRHVDGIAADLVMGDNAETTRKLVAHLVEQGHRKIALINGPDTASNARERRQAFTDALILNGLQWAPEDIIETHFRQDNFPDIVRSLMSLAPSGRPTSILAANNFIGVNTLRALREMNLRVPEDIAVACFDDPEPIPDYNPFLTVAAQPAYDMGFIGMQMLIERIEGKAPAAKRKVLLPSQLIIRKSTQQV